MFFRINDYFSSTCGKVFIIIVWDVCLPHCTHIVLSLFTFVLLLPCFCGLSSVFDIFCHIIGSSFFFNKHTFVLFIIDMGSIQTKYWTPVFRISGESVAGCAVSMLGTSSSSMQSASNSFSIRIDFHLPPSKKRKVETFPPPGLEPGSLGWGPNILTS